MIECPYCKESIEITQEDWNMEGQWFSKECEHCQETVEFSPHMLITYLYDVKASCEKNHQYEPALVDEETKLVCAICGAEMALTEEDRNILDSLDARSEYN